MAPWDKAWEITNKAMAYTTQCYVATANSVGTDECYSYFGRSMILNPDGTILTEAPMGQEWLIKADLYPAIISKGHEQRVTSNFQWTHKHRGAAYPDFAGMGKGLESYSNQKTDQ
jgi:predicted amidohydrolase